MVRLLPRAKISPSLTSTRANGNFVRLGSGARFVQRYFHEIKIAHGVLYLQRSIARAKHVVNPGEHRRPNSDGLTLSAGVKKLKRDANRIS